MKFLSIGHVCLDVAPNGHVIGGGAAYSAITARNLGADAHMLTAFGTDFDSNVEMLRGIHVHNVGSPATTIFRNTYTPRGRVQHVLSAAARVEASPYLDVWRGTDVVYLCPIDDEVTPEVVRCVDGGIIGAAPQGWLRSWSEDGLVRPKRWDDAELVLPRVDLVVLSEEDVALVPDELPRYRELAPRVIVTRGRLGARLYESGASTDFPAYAAKEVDPTGAGDVFAAALLIYWSGRRDADRAICFANCVASFAVEDVGTRGIPTREQVAERWREPLPAWIDGSTRRDAV